MPKSPGDGGSVAKVGRGSLMEAERPRTSLFVGLIFGDRGAWVDGGTGECLFGMRGTRTVGIRSLIGGGATGFGPFAWLCDRGKG